MANVKVAPGSYTFAQFFGLVDFDFEGAAYVEDDGAPRVDYRKVKVGGLSFDDLDQTFVVPESADVVEVTVDGEVVKSASVGA